MSKPLALVTGASRGIGRAIARDLATDHRVILLGRDADALAEAADGLEDAETRLLDVADADAVAAFELPEAVDVLVHAAGVTQNGTVEEQDRDTWRWIFEINVFGVADLTRRALPALREAQGTVVLINSGAGLFSSPGNSVYSGSKFALNTFGDCLREEERENGVRVVSVHPGIVDTEMGHGAIEHSADAHPERMLTVETIAAGVRVAVDAPPEAQFETISIRPTLDPKG